MKIGEVEKITGLTQKAIRLYEKKKLLCVDRTDSDYRDYGENDVNRLKTIKSFRLAGIGLARIKMWADGIVSYDELLKQRLAEIDRESEISEGMYKLCKDLLAHTKVSEESFALFDESEVKSVGEIKGKLALGIDIGTTTVSASVNKLSDAAQVEAYNILNDSATESENSFAKEQSPEHIADKTVKMINSLLSIYPEISVIGFSGQMHGIVYVDKDGNAVSNLYTWQDKRGDEPYGNGRTYAQEMTKATGIPVSSGYGLVTHFYNMKNGLVSEKAVKICTIMDYAAMKLCGRKTPLMHLSNAASLGLFDVKKGLFDKSALVKLGISESILPETTGENKIQGFYREIPVSVAMGDNQASFLGAVSEPDDSILVNYGTGSQISFVSRYMEATGEMELRPFLGEKYLLCGAALCGGRAYAILENFFRSYLAECGIEPKKQYSVMNRLAENALDMNFSRLPEVDTRFCGTRSNPNISGSILHLDEKNFTPQSIITGTLYGMANELYEMYENAGRPPFNKLVASGNGVRKNEALKKILSRVFGLELGIPQIKEEAAYGAAKFGKLCIERMNEYEEL